MEGSRLWSTQTGDGRFLQVRRRFFVSPMRERRNLVQRANKYEITISLFRTYDPERDYARMKAAGVFRSLGRIAYISIELIVAMVLFCSQRAENVRNGSMTTKANLMQPSPPCVAPVTANSMTNLFPFFSSLFGLDRLDELLLLVSLLMMISSP